MEKSDAHYRTLLFNLVKAIENLTGSDDERKDVIAAYKKALKTAQNALKQGKE